jgi:hypothetical protein
LSKDYEDIAAVVKKLIITDLVSYCDNFITRTNLSIGAKQREDGLDKIVAGVDFSKANNIINEFLENFKFAENLDSIRQVRDKSCGHIDRNIAIELLKIDLDSIRFDDLESFYWQIKKTYKKICYEEMVFKTFCLDPKDRLYDVQQMVSIPVKSYSKGLTPITEFESIDVNDLHNYQLYFDFLDKEEKYEEARHFFLQCFSNSTLVKKVSYSIENGFFQRARSIDYRIAHKYFCDLLVSEEIALQHKQKILQLFSECKSGYPDTLLYILVESYSINKENNSLNLRYIHLFGELCSDNCNIVINILKDNLLTNDFYKYYNALLSIYKIDIKSRQYLTPNIDSKESELSQFVKNEISQSADFLQITLSLAFSSELHFSNGYCYYKKALQELYLNYFEDVFKQAIKTHLDPVLKSDIGKGRLSDIIRFFDLNRYSALIGLLGELLTKKGYEEEAILFRTLLYEGIVKYAYNDNSELCNFGAICFELNDISLAVRVAEYLVNNNPNDWTYYYFLLSVYLKDIEYKDKFLITKDRVLRNFKLDNEAKNRFEILQYEE